MEVLTLLQIEEDTLSDGELSDFKSPVDEVTSPLSVDSRGEKVGIDKSESLFYRRLVSADLFGFAAIEAGHQRAGSVQL